MRDDFQTVREALAIGWPEGDHAEPNVFTDALAALSSIERHVQDMETALGRIADAVEAWDNFVNFCGHLARAALPTREKEEE